MIDSVQPSIATARKYRFFGSAVEVFEAVKEGALFQRTWAQDAYIHSSSLLVGNTVGFLVPNHMRAEDGGPLSSSPMEHVRRAYEARSSEYIELFGSTTAVHRDDPALITRYLSIRSGLVLDVGCGPGHLTAHLRSLGVDATGIDLVPEFIEHAHSLYPDGRQKIGSMHQLSLPDGSVAGMLAWYSLIHVTPADINSVLIELRRVLKTGGPLVIGFFDGDELVAFDHAVLTAFYWPADELTARLRAAGFAEVERQQRPGSDQRAHRPHGTIVASAE